MKIDTGGSTPRFLRLAEADTAPQHEAVQEQHVGLQRGLSDGDGRYAFSIQSYGDRKHLGVFGTFPEVCGAR
jgi:hypothetical protein